MGRWVPHWTFFFHATDCEDKLLAPGCARALRPPSQPPAIHPRRFRPLSVLSKVRARRGAFRRVFVPRVCSFQPLVVASAHEAVRQHTAPVSPTERARQRIETKGRAENWKQQLRRCTVCVRVCVEIFQPCAPSNTNTTSGRTKCDLFDLGSRNEKIISSPPPSPPVACVLRRCAILYPNPLAHCLPSHC